MRPFSLGDTIVASAAAAGSPLAILRLSGPDSHELAQSLCVPPVAPPARLPSVHAVRVRTAGAALPAWLVRFAAGASYTGEPIAEIHMPGNAILLERACGELAARGARCAQPGEFTARAFAAGRISAEQVDGVHALLSATDADTARAAARLAGGERRRALDAIHEEVLDLLASVEAGIDFSDEPDVRFVQPAELHRRLLDLAGRLRHATNADALSRRRLVPHVALAGAPNAGKSTLFNALLGRERAIVSATPHTTRDVIQDDASFGGAACILQDCAGMGDAVSELELAAHRAAQATADIADVVIWVHATDAPWSDAERAALRSIDARRVLHVRTKSDCALPGTDPPETTGVNVSVVTGEGIESLRAAIGERLARVAAPASASPVDGELISARECLLRAASLADGTGPQFPDELVASELADAAMRVEQARTGGSVEAVLRRIFSRFCIGK